MKRYAVLYAVVLLIFGLGIFFTLEHGRSLKPPGGTVEKQAEAIKPAATPAHVAPADGSIWAGLEANLHEPLTRLFLQLIVIVMATRLAGMLFQRMGQPAVVGEMFAGILLGPSLFGALFPQAFNFVFLSSSLGSLKLFSQIGVCLFMFIVGMELDVAGLRQQARTAIAVSNVSIIFPYFLGVASSLFLYTKLAGPGTSFVSFALFIGISMSITAFPVLARILKDRGMEQTPLGTMATISAAVGDVTAWTILAFVVAIAKSTGITSNFVNLSLVVGFIVVMLLLVKPRLARWFNAHDDAGGTPSQGTLALVLVFTFTAALATEIIGIHALFGAFLAGVVMPPQEKFRQYLTVRLENFSATFLVPLFFAFTGLRTQIGLLNDFEGWFYCGLIIVIATVGKLGGTMIAARFTGMSWIDSFSLGALMNTRGLMELIAINIGYDLGILSGRIFAMLVIMALVTTFMTGPMLNLAATLRRRNAVPTAQ
jgi:Kef-type K+ transport system membrane component KefB